MKIAVLGYAGSGKSTLARQIGEHLGVPVLHLDRVHFLPGWVERDLPAEQTIVRDFLDSHDSWVIDGNYRKLCYERRLEEADEIWILLFGRLTRFWRICRRYQRFRGQGRPDMAEGCAEKLDADFAFWVLWKGCTPEKDRRMRDIVRRYPEKSHLLTDQLQVDAALRLFREAHP